MQRGLYVITDRPAAHGRAHDEVVQAALRGGAAVIQLRDKDCSPADLIATARRLSRMCHDAGAAFIVNDDAAIAAEAGADGVHLGPFDGGVAEARELLGPDAIVGYSAKASVELAIAAERQGASYVVAGSIFPTATKSDASVVGTAPLTAIRAALSVPVGAIGGIGVERASEVLAAGADLVCVISAVVGAEDIEAAARAFVTQIQAFDRKDR
ncbi:MAG: thiamine phosphate synthase [Chloroflexi bacterium]|nr:thiamine phosphate synthase [Chloroflexota bacterium]